MLRFINHISSTQYWFTGYYLTPAHDGPQPFIASGSFLNNSGLLRFHGTYRVGQRGTAHPLDLRVISWGSRSVVIELRGGHIGTMRGHWYFMDEHYELLASGPTGSAASAHVELGGPEEIIVRGAVRHAGEALAFSASGTPGDDQVDLSELMPVPTVRRA